MKIYARDVEEAVKIFEKIKAAETDPEAAGEMEAQPDDYAKAMAELGVE